MDEPKVYSNFELYENLDDLLRRIMCSPACTKFKWQHSKRSAEPSFFNRYVPDSAIS